jgi:hypothetical protein
MAQIYIVVIDHTPERAGFDYEGLEITRKWSNGNSPIA